MLRKAFLLFLVTVWSTCSWAQLPGRPKPNRPGIDEPKYLFRAHAEESKAIEDIDQNKEIPVEATAELIQNAFLDLDESALQTALVAERKINLSLRIDEEENDHYGATQVRYIFKRIFESVMTRSFDIRQGDIRRLSAKEAEIRARWRYLVVDTEEELSKPLHFRLTLEDGATAWRVYSISDR